MGHIITSCRQLETRISKATVGPMSKDKKHVNRKPSKDVAFRCFQEHISYFMQKDVGKKPQVVSILVNPKQAKDVASVSAVSCNPFEVLLRWTRKSRHYYGSVVTLGFSRLQNT